MTNKAINELADLVVGSVFSNIHSIPSVSSYDKISSLFDALAADSPERFGEKVYSVDGFAYPFNVIYEMNKTSDEIASTRLEFALAGFAKDEIDVQIEDDELIITVKPADQKDRSATEKYVKRGISKRRSVARFSLSAKIDKEGVTSEFENGLLIVRVPVTNKNTIKVPVK